MNVKQCQARFYPSPTHLWKEEINWKDYSAHLPAAPVWPTNGQQMQAQQHRTSNDTRADGTDSSSAFAQHQTGESTSKSSRLKKKVMDKKYRRYEKPPYSYVGLIALAIQSSEAKKLKLSEVLSRISTMFPFFKGEYQGWRDSVRHNLTQNKCFIKVLPDPAKPQSKGNYWSVDVDLIPADKLKRQNTYVSRNVAPGLSYARDLTDVFDLRTGQLKKHAPYSNCFRFLANENCQDNDETPPENASFKSQWNAERTNQQVNTSYDGNKSFSIWNHSYKGDDCNPSFSSTDDPSQESPLGSSHLSSTTDNVDYQYSEQPKVYLSHSASGPSTDSSSVPTDSSDDEGALRPVADQSRLPRRGLDKLTNRSRTARRRQKRKRLFLKANIRDTRVQSIHLLNVPDSAAKASDSSVSGTCASKAHLNREKCNLSALPPDQSCQNHATSTIKVPQSTQLFSSIDEAVGPAGPPNVTWLSADPLKTVRAFFDDVPQADDSSYAPSNAGPHCQSRNNFIDQTQFLTEQAAILRGRNDYLTSSRDAFDFSHRQPFAKSTPVRFENSNANVFQGRTPQTWNNCLDTSAPFCRPVAPHPRYDVTPSAYDLLHNPQSQSASVHNFLRSSYHHLNHVTSSQYE